MKDLELNNDILKKEIVKLNNELNLEKNNSQKLNQKIKDLENNMNSNLKEKESKNLVNMTTKENSINTLKGEKKETQEDNINGIIEENDTKKEKEEDKKDININKIDDDDYNGENKNNLLIELNKELKNLNESLNKTINIDKMNELLEEIRIKDKIISSYPVQLLEGEKLLSVIFVSIDKKINYSVICKNTNKFNEIENILYDAYPEYVEKENYFVVNGKEINKYESLDFNNIQNNDIITLMIKE